MKTFLLLLKLSVITVFVFLATVSFAQEAPKKDLTDIINQSYIAEFFHDSNAIYVVRNSEVCERYNCEGEMTLFEKPVKIMRIEDKFMLKPAKYVSLEINAQASRKIDMNFLY